MDLDLVVEEVEDGTRDQVEEEDQVTGDQELHHDL